MFVALAGLRIYLIYGNFRSLDMWDELGFSRTYLNWGYTVADGAAVAMVIGLYSRFMSVKQLALLGCFAVCATFLLVGGARAPLLGVGLAGLVVISVRIPRVGPGRFEVSVGQLAGITVGVAAAGLIAAMIMTGNTTTTLSRFMHHRRAGRRRAGGRRREPLAVLAGGRALLARRRRLIGNGFAELLLHVPQGI